MALSPAIKRGILSLPGSDASSKATAEQLLEKDFLDHHCYFLPIGFHNHNSHHILAAYDLGASAPLLQAIFDEEAKVQRPIDLKENGVVPEGVIRPGDIKEDNWTKWLGDPKAYSAYTAFFSGRVSALGIVKTLEDYVFSPAANENGACMLFRLCAELLHAFIQIGYGLEFDNEIQVAAGLALAAVHAAQDAIHNPFEETVRANRASTKEGPSILSLLRELYESPELVPVLPYNPDADEFRRFADLLTSDGGSRPRELKRIMSQFDPGETPEALEAHVEELVFASTLIMFGTGKKGRKPRVDFFLMHLLTSSIFFPAFFKHLRKIQHKRALIKTYLQVWAMLIIFRGRPRIDPSLLMSYTDHPAPPNTSNSNAHTSAIGAQTANSINPWPAIVADALHAPDSHTIKSLRTLLYGAVKYGTVSKGGVIGAFGKDGKETHPGMGDVDGTIFARAAGVLMNSMGWVTHGQEARDWDRSGLGWDDAWKNGD